MDPDIVDVLFPDESVSFQRQDAITVYKNVNVDEFLLYDEETKSYSYNSDKSSAWYADGKLAQDPDAEVAGFWPFDNENSVGRTNLDPPETGFFYTGSNWFFGMDLSFNFYKPENGQFNNQDMIFSFSGDDDVWVFLTDLDHPEKGSLLVLDIGGNHGVMDGSINFASGEVKYSNKNARTKERYYDSRNHTREVYPVIYNVKGCDTNQVDEDGIPYSTYSTDSLAEFINNGTNFRLDFYYLERGGNASNCKIQFNLPVIPKQGVTVSKQLTGKLTEAIKNDYYKFNLVSSNDFEVLDKVRTGKETLQENEGNVISTEFNPIQGAGQSSLSEVLEQGEFFYIEEVDPTGTSNVSWTVASSGTGNVSPVKETSAGQTGTVYYSAIYQVPETDEDTGFLFMCTNEFGSLNPTVKKQAWKDNSIDSEGIYDIVLEVTGDEIQTETGTGSSDALNVVFVMDKSTSISKSDFEGMKESVVDIAKNLEAGSQVSVIAFSGDGRGEYHYSYDNPASRKYYTNVTNGWLQFNGTGESDESVSKLRRALAGIEQSGYTHTAAGFLGAKNMLNELGDNSNPKVVIFMTDGRPNTYIHTDISKDYKYVGQGNGSYTRVWGGV